MKLHTTSGGWHLAALVLALLPLSAGAQTVTTGKPYVPKFARVQTSALLLDFDLCMQPEYPRNSARNEEEGSTTVVFRVAKNGVDLAVSIARSSGFRDLDRATVAAVTGCKFRPATIDGKPVQGIGTTVYEWKLE